MADKTYLTPLLKKLGVQSLGVNIIVSAPDSFISELENNDIGCIKTQSESLEFIEKSFDSEESADYIHVFTKSLEELKMVFPKLRKMLTKDGCFWVSWPKKTSRIKTDLSDLVVIKTGLSFGLVDVKVVAIDETWSGLKFVYRKKDR